MGRGVFSEITGFFMKGWGSFCLKLALCGMGFLLLFLAALADTSGADPYRVGMRIPAFTLQDQHGRKHTVDQRVRLVLFCREKRGQDIISEALKETGEGYLESRNVAFVADSSGMPGFIAKFVALPALRKRPYKVLLDPGPSVTRDFPSERDRVALIALRELTITAVEFVDTSQQVTKAIENAVR